ncbi:MAG TPA: SDR family NAD(P)-dependent oxidoreductase, partial [Candidatus Saccharimonadales bacterium]|nr:SDR family NAD(P)-dependent oxidoreductase [Candidatus Saccharimonadales bacterium]
LLARSADDLKDAAREIGARARGGRAAAFPADVTDPAALAEAFAAAGERLGPIGILVNAAGYAASAPFEKTSAGEVRRHLEVNLLGAYRAIALAWPEMTRRGGGAVVNVASTAGLEGFAYASAYTASKHALVGLTRALAKEGAPKGIRVNAVCPGFTDTALLERSVETIVKSSGRSREEARAQLGGMNRSGRLLKPEEVAAAVGWLLSPRGAELNGEAILVEGLPGPWSPPGEGVAAPLPVNPEDLGKASGYSNGMLMPPGRRLFVAGQIAWDRDHRIVGGDDFAAQFDAALANVLRVVGEAGGSPGCIGRLRIYVSDRERYLSSLGEIGRRYRARMGRHYPAMTLVEAGRLLEEGALVEIEAEAVL